MLVLVLNLELIYEDQTAEEVGDMDEWIICCGSVYHLRLIGSYFCLISGCRGER